MEGVRLDWEVLSTVLNAAPIPEPLTSAVTTILDPALSVINDVDCVKENVEDAKALVIYVAVVANMILNPAKTKPPDSLDKSPKTKKRLQELKLSIPDEGKILMARKLRQRIFSYVRDAGRFSEMKRRAGGAINQL
ncbi:hypothetical protein FRB96_003897 [Tulasnella sp. 330]|nr:hypothetical protein FRB96_003897 [Tulasnella sp. 330]